MDADAGSVVRSAVRSSGVLESAGWPRTIRHVVGGSHEPPMASNAEASGTSATESIRTSSTTASRPLHLSALQPSSRPSLPLLQLHQSLLDLDDQLLPRISNGFEATALHSVQLGRECILVCVHDSVLYVVCKVQGRRVGVALERTSWECKCFAKNVCEISVNVVSACVRLGKPESSLNQS